MPFIYQFPLFNAFLRGNLSPFNAENQSDTNFKLRLQEQLIASATDEGLYALRFPKPLHPKQEFYRRALLSETYAYCNELRTELTAETNPDIRAYYREVILDRHLTTCLQQLGELIAAKKLTYQMVINPTADLTQEDGINAWCMHLLKVCLAKAYLEIQEALADVVMYTMSETELYSTYLKELKPIALLNKRSSTPEATKPTKSYTEKPLTDMLVASPAVTPAPVTTMAYLTTKEVAEILKVTTKTITRNLEKGEFIGRKIGGQWRIEKQWFENYMQTLTQDKN